MRPIDPVDEFAPEKRPPFQNVWFRAVDTLPDDRALHQCVLAYASDLTLLDTSNLPHGVSWWSEKFQTASLDHAMWFHRPFRADEWLLYAQDSPRAAGARGFNRGSVFTRAGELVASVTQEGLIRCASLDRSRTPGRRNCAWPAGLVGEHERAPARRAAVAARAVHDVAVEEDHRAGGRLDRRRARAPGSARSTSV